MTEWYRRFYYLSCHQKLPIPRGKRWVVQCIKYSTVHSPPSHIPTLWRSHPYPCRVSLPNQVNPYVISLDYELRKSLCTFDKINPCIFFPSKSLLCLLPQEQKSLEAEKLHSLLLAWKTGWASEISCLFLNGTMAGRGCEWMCNI